MYTYSTALHIFELSVQGTEGMVLLLLGETRYTEGRMVEEKRIDSGSGLSELRTSE